MARDQSDKASRAIWRRIARDVLADWTAPDGVRAAIAANKAWKSIFANTPEAASLLLTDLVTAFRLMHDVKLLPVMGAKPDVAKPRIGGGLAQRPFASAILKLNLESDAGDRASAADGDPAGAPDELDTLLRGRRARPWTRCRPIWARLRPMHAPSAG